MTFVNERKNLRVIDYERGAILRPVAGIGRSSAEYFEFDWQGEIIELTTVCQNRKLDDVSWHLERIVLQVSVPKQLTRKKNEYRSLIIEALDTYGVCFGKPNTTESRIVINPDLADL